MSLTKKSIGVYNASAIHTATKEFAMQLDKQKQEELSYGTQHEVDEVNYDDIVGLYDSSDDNDEANSINFSDELWKFEREQSFLNIDDDLFDIL